MTESELPPEGYETCELCGCFKTDLHASICSGVRPPTPEEQVHAIGRAAGEALREHANADGKLVFKRYTQTGPGTLVEQLSDRDPWKPRREVMACGSCAWYSPKEIMPHEARCRECGANDGQAHQLMYVRDSRDQPYVRKCYIGQGQKEFKMIRVGSCRHHSPTASGFPVVHATDWCGDHKLNKEAL